MNKPRILLVDDEERVMTSIRRSLENEYDFEVAASGSGALKKLESLPPFAAIVADHLMPGMTGLELLQTCKKRYPDMIRIILTGYAQLDVAMESINRGNVFRFLTKPCVIAEVQSVLGQAVEQYQLVSAERELLHGTVKGVIELLTGIMPLLDPIGFSRMPQVCKLIENSGRELPGVDVSTTKLAAMLGFIGCITVPQPVFIKMRAGMELSPQEERVMQRIPLESYNLLKKIPRLEDIANLVFFLSRKAREKAVGEIPMEAELLCVAYRFAELSEGMDEHEAVGIIERAEPTFDATVVTALKVALGIERKGAAKPGSDKGEPVYRIVEISPEQLEEGQVLAKNITAENGVVLIPAGTRLNAVMVSRVTNYLMYAPVDLPIKSITEVTISAD